MFILGVYSNGRRHDALRVYAGFTLSHRTQTVKRTEYKRLRLEIVEDHPDVGFYLNLYDGNRCIADHLQNDEEACKRFAYEEYGVEPTLWQDVPDD